jgi:HPt (histidine-containing phosphotransfer) domain-containing protein
VTTNPNTIDSASGASAALPPSDIFDLEGLRNRCMGDLNLAHNVLKIFQERMPVELKTIEDALQRQDVELVARVAHRIRGTSASISAASLARAAEEIESAGRQGRVDDIPTGVGHLHDEWEKYLNCAAALLSAANNT